MGWIGGVLLICFGLFNLFSRVKLKDVDDEKKTVHAHFIAKGFLLNFLNPAVLFFWLGIVSMVSLKESYSRQHEIVFFCTTLFTVFFTDVFKSFIAHRIKKILKPKVMLWLNRIIGLILIGFGLNMILDII
jgi:threonine/homoserine/homoserine lactone efflux protein